MLVLTMPLYAFGQTSDRLKKAGEIRRDQRASSDHVQISGHGSNNNQQHSASDQSGKPVLRILEIKVNGRPLTKPKVVLVKNGNLYLEDTTLKQLRLTVPLTHPVKHQGQLFYPVTSHDGVNWDVNEKKQIAYVKVPAKFMEEIRISYSSEAGGVIEGGDVSAFINYDLLGESVEGEADFGSIFEVGGYFGGFSLVSTQGYRTREAGDNAFRLETTLYHDEPEDRVSWEIGDTISEAGGWGRAVRFGGIRYATNFGTQPNFIPFPTPELSGNASLPSTVDIFVNDARRFRENVPGGPFTITDLPVVTGAGEVRAVVRDVLGRERVISSSYYTSRSLLRKGLDAFSYEVGFLREDFGLKSFSYGKPFVSGTHRHGMTDFLTAEAHGELTPERQALGVGGTAKLGNLGVLEGAIAGAQDGGATGGLIQLGYDYKGNAWSFSTFGRRTTSDYTDFGTNGALGSPREELRTRVGLSLGRFGHVSSSYVVRTFSDREDEQVLSGFYGVPVPNVGNLTLDSLLVDGSSQDFIVGLSLHIPLGGRTSGSARLQRGAERNEARLQAQHSAPREGGWGWDVSASQNSFSRFRGRAVYESGMGALSGTFSRIGGTNGFRVNGRGGVAIMPDDIFLSERLNGSFAVVSVPEQDDVRVFQENQLVGRTDEEGKILITNLRPYEPNRIKIEARDLPVNAEISDDRKVVVPSPRSGLQIVFPAEIANSVILYIQFPSGRPIPAGSQVYPGQSGQKAYVGSEGKVVLRGLRQGQLVSVAIPSGTCQFTVDYPIPETPMRRVGPVTCQRVEEVKDREL